MASVNEHPGRPSVDHTSRYAGVLAPSVAPPNENTPHELYRARLTERSALLTDLERQRNTAGTLRLAIFVFFAAATWYAIHGSISAWLITLPVLAFIAQVARQSRLERACDHTRRAIAFYERGLARIENRWHATPSEPGAAPGERFRDPNHPYSGDLDLFGHASLFHLLSTARTPGGEARLASWLQAPAPPDEIRARHVAIEELRRLVDLREQLAVAGDDFHQAHSPADLATWGIAPPNPFPQWKRRTAFILSAAALLALTWWFGSDLADQRAEAALVVAALFEALIAIPIRTRILAAVENVGKPARDLNLLSEVLAILEKQEFVSPRLATLRAALNTDGQSASRRIARLRRLMDLLDSRDSPLVRAIGPLILWTTQLGMAVEAWRADNGPHVDQWIDAVSEIEALTSLANYAWEHPQDPFPDLIAGAVFTGDELGHPLLSPDKCVRNSVSLKAPLGLLIVSGSNMSGKSTLLRTIGINAVLAFAGAPVRAGALTLSSLSIGASIRTMDSLEEGHSRFMAEILRLKQVLELPAPALFLLDELLGGTNSHDRALGSEGLIRALLERGSIGLVTTHDLSLSRLAEQLAPAAENVHFEDRLENGLLHFDYTLKSGTVTRSNALDLMRAVGLKV